MQEKEPIAVKLQRLRQRAEFELRRLQSEHRDWADVRSVLVLTGHANYPMISSPLDSTVIDVGVEVQVWKDKLKLIENIAEKLGICKTCLGTKISGHSPDRENGGVKVVPCEKCVTVTRAPETNSLAVKT